MATTLCTAGTTATCYTGEADTLGIGTCREGVQICSADGTGYGPCIGEVLPSKDICGNALDEDCNGSDDKGASCLTNAGLVVRYVLDEAANGTAPATVMDSADNPLNLTVHYGIENNMSFTEAPTGRGLRWLFANSSGAASAPIDGTKVYNALQTKTQATIEVVVELQAITGNMSRIFTIAAGSESGRFTLASPTTDRVQFRWLDAIVAGDWPLNFANSGRCVLHVVVDTTDATEANRVRLYFNGTLVQGNTAMPLVQFTTIDIGPGRNLLLGNRDEFIRSFAGALYYAALYDRPLLDAEIVTHAYHLLVNDDQ
jgi:hypothetical protein